MGRLTSRLGEKRFCLVEDALWQHAQFIDHVGQMLHILDNELRYGLRLRRVVAPLCRLAVLAFR